MNITLVISTLALGGAERVAVNVADMLAARGHTVRLITLWSHVPDFYSLSPQVERVRLYLAQSAANRLQAPLRAMQRLAELRRAVLSAPTDVVVAFMPTPNLMTQLALVGTGIPIVVSEHNTADHLTDSWSRLRRWFYPRANRLVCVSRGVEQAYDWLSPSRRCVIYNALDLPRLDAQGEPLAWNPDRKHLIGMGRLTDQKGFDLLIQAFAPLAERFPEWDVVILGEGEQRSALTAQITQAGLQGRVQLVGSVAHPFPTLRRADVFAFTSRHEGFGNALAEAMACGVASISFDCPFGPSEIITPDHDGLLIPPQDVAAFSAGLARLMGDAHLRSQFAHNGLAIRERLNFATIGAQWEALLAEVVKH